NFMPSTGKITYMKNIMTNGMREDTGIEQGNEISIYYDPMISKLISHGATREVAIDKMKRALKDYKLAGIKTNIAFLLRLLESAEFVNGNYHTQFIEKEFLSRVSEVNTEVTDINEVASSLAGVLFKNKNVKKTAVSKNTSTSNKNLWTNKRLENYR
ncbi:MAG: acetyl-CoA carboxylase biotin carboxylase subunit, partial [Ignavibacteria bacterium]|nr:acetyl-CoA carboxylase biotin carboxylase subunit [Ignavibacteria bacterium]